MAQVTNLRQQRGHLMICFENRILTLNRKYSFKIKITLNSLISTRYTNLVAQNIEHLSFVS